MLKNILAICLLLSALQVKAQELDLIFHWQDPDMTPSTAFGNAWNEIWGFVQNDREFAVIGSSDGTHFFDVTDGDNIVEVGYVAGKSQGAHMIHRDYHDYNGYLYAVADEGASSLQIIDLRSLPESIEVVYDSDEHFERSHNIFIDVDQGILYTQSQKAPNASMSLYSLADPENPTFMHTLDFLDAHDAYVRDGICFFNRGWSGFEIIDFNNPLSPVTLGSLTDYEFFGQGYNHSGWLSNDGNTYAMCDENHGLPIKILDVSDYSDISVVSVLEMKNDSSMVHNVMFRDDYLICSYYHDGIVIYDLSDPSNPEKVAEYDTYDPEHYTSYRGAWGIYSALPSGKLLISDMQTGLYVFESDLFSDPIGIEQIEPNFSLNYSARSAVLNIASTINYDSELNWFICDVTGRTVQSGELLLSNGQNSLSVSQKLSAGIYVFSIGDTNSRESLKFHVH